ncbi:MAG: metalloprotease TldD [Planctomycetota bacterium]
MAGGALSKLLGGPIDDGDLYFEYRTNEALQIEDGIVKQATRNVTQGVGVRANSEAKTGYAYSDDITPGSLEIASARARAIAATGAGDQSVAVKAPRRAHDLYPVDQPTTDVPLETKISLLEEIDRQTRAIDPRIEKVIASVTTEHKLVLIARADGQVVGDVRPLTRFNVSCIAADGDRREQGYAGAGGRQSFSMHADRSGLAELAERAARQAIRNLTADDAPAGTFDVVLGPGWPGILLHEAIGHGLEGDFNRKGTSAFSNRIGQKVASPLCTVIDDGTLPGRRGSLNVDDEGTQTQRTVLIEDGILRGYLQDRLNSRLMGVAPTGNGRRESYQDPTFPRMTNTFMLAGDSDPEEILRSVKRGLFAQEFGGGQVDITSGKFVFSASEAFLIEDGKITRPVKGATLIGNGPDVLTRVSMVGNDLELDHGVGTCGKEGQSVPVGVGLPTIRVDGLTVGGTR